MTDPVQSAPGHAEPRFAELRAGWPLLMAASVSLFFVHGLQVQTLPFAYGAIAQQTGWTREQVTLLSSFQFVSGAVMAIVFGQIMDLIGDRRAVMIIMVVNGFAVGSFLFIDSLWQYYLAGGVMGMTGSAMFNGVKIMVSRQFEKRQGAAVGLSLTGSDIAGAVGPLLIVMLLARFDWRASLAVLSLGTWFVALPIFWWATRPGALGPAVAAQGVSSVNRWRFYGQLFRKKTFWMVGLSVFLVGSVDMGISQHQVLFLQHDRGLQIGYIAAITSVFAIVAVMSKVVFGAVFDRFSVKGVVVAYLIAATYALLALLVVGPLTALLFVVLRGVGRGALIVDVPVLAKQVFGNVNLGLIIGMFSAFLQLGFAFGPFVMGRLQAMSGSYIPGFVVFAVFAIIAAFTVSRVVPEHWLAIRRANQGHVDQVI